MKKLWLFLALSACAFGENQNFGFQLYTSSGAPSSCVGSTWMDVDTTTGNIYTCVAGVVTLSGNTASGAGNVNGPASATSGHIATFNGATGKIIQDGGAVPTGTVTSITFNSPLTGGTVTGSGSAGCTTCATSSAGGRYSVNLQFGAGASLSPANATTYNFGFGAPAPVSTASPSPVTTTAIPLVSPIACTITSLTYSLLVTGTKDTAANNITFKIYDETTTTAFADTAGTLTTQTNDQHSVVVTGAADAISAGDQLLVEFLTPTFTTPPINVYFNAVVFCQP